MVLGDFTLAEECGGYCICPRKTQQGTGDGPGSATQVMGQRATQEEADYWHHSFEHSEDGGDPEAQA